MANHKRAHATDLVEALLVLIEEHGDLPIFFEDPDTGWIMDVGVIKDHVSLTPPNDIRLKPGDCYIAITSSYTDKPYGAL